jgi:hypothetical protein
VFKSFGTILDSTGNRKQFEVWGENFTNFIYFHLKSIEICSRFRSLPLMNRILAQSEAEVCSLSSFVDTKSW